jgi:hypothetical protein
MAAVLQLTEASEDYVDLALQSADLLCERGSLSPDFIAGVTRHALGSLNGAPCRQVTLTGSGERILQAVDSRHDLRAQGCEVILSGHLVLDHRQRALDTVEGIVAHSCQYGLP